MEKQNSQYLYPGTNVVKNKLGIKDEKTLKEVETKLVSLRLYSIISEGITGDFNKEHLIEIHKYLFSDLYDFAGQFRTENIAKDNFRFASVEFIESSLEELLKDVKAKLDNKKNKKELAKYLAYLASELNVIHPFREGNGRSIREFIRQCALYKKYILDFRKIEINNILDAYILSVFDTSKLEDIFYTALVNVENE